MIIACDGCGAARDMDVFDFGRRYSLSACVYCGSPNTEDLVRNRKKPVKSPDGFIGLLDAELPNDFWGSKSSGILGRSFNAEKYLLQRDSLDPADGWWETDYLTERAYYELKRCQDVPGYANFMYKQRSV